MNGAGMANEEKRTAEIHFDIKTQDREPPAGKRTSPPDTENRKVPGNP